MRVSAEPFTGFSSLVKHTHRHSLLLALLIISYKTFVAHIYKSAIAKFSNQLYPAMLQPWLCSSELFISCCGVCAFFFFSCWTAPWCSLNSWVVCHLKAQHCYKERIKVLSRHPGWFAPLKTLENRDNMLAVIWSYLLRGFVYISCSHIIFWRCQPGVLFIKLFNHLPLFKAWMLIGANFRWAEPRHPGDANRCRDKYVSTSWF